MNRLSRFGSLAARVVIMVGSVGALPSAAAAQGLPRPAAEFSAGWAGFVEDSNVDGRMAGGSARVYITPRLSIGPDVAFMTGPNTITNLLATGDVWFDLSRSAAGRRQIMPYLLAGDGIFRYCERFATGRFSHTEGGFTGGGGVRIPLGASAYVAPEVRIGWELHVRASVTIGIQLSR